MTDKKFLVQSFNKVKSVTTLDQFYEQCKSSMDRHWESTYESNKDPLNFYIVRRIDLLHCS